MKVNHKTDFSLLKERAAVFEHIRHLKAMKLSQLSRLKDWLPYILGLDLLKLTDYFPDWNQQPLGTF